MCIVMLLLLSNCLYPYLCIPFNVSSYILIHLLLHISVPIVDENDQVTLGFIHVVHNGMVGMDGDVYVGDKKIVPQRYMEKVHFSVSRN